MTAKILTREEQAQAAYEAHQVMLLMELSSPSLARNPAWQFLRAEAFAQFQFAFLNMGAK